MVIRKKPKKERVIKERPVKEKPIEEEPVEETPIAEEQEVPGSIEAIQHTAVEEPEPVHEQVPVKCLDCVFYDTASWRGPTCRNSKSPNNGNRMREGDSCNYSTAKTPRAAPEPQEPKAYSSELERLIYEETEPDV